MLSAAATVRFDDGVFLLDGNARADRALVGAAATDAIVARFPFVGVYRCDVALTLSLSRWVDDVWRRSDVVVVQFLDNALTLPWARSGASCARLCVDVLTLVFPRRAVRLCLRARATLPARVDAAPGPLVLVGQRRRTTFALC